MSALLGNESRSLAAFADTTLIRAMSSLVLAAVFAVASAAWAGSATAADAPDAWITTKVKMALLTADDISATAVHVDTTDGKVTLHGTVSNEGEKARAERTARNVEGVRAMRNLLQVVEKPRQEAAAVADDAISTAVEKRLQADAGLRDSKIDVKSVNRGVILLSGDAKTLSAHLRALELTRSVPGVKRVASEIKSPDSLADNEIWRDENEDASSPSSTALIDAWTTTAAKVRLITHSETPARDINVDTSNGIVTLFGTVPTEAARRAAEAEVAKVDSVKSIQNDLQVVAHVSAAAVEDQDKRSKQAIEKRLNARNDLSDADIDVEVANGVARLKGTVRSRTDRLTALTVAGSTNGIRSVLADDLSVKKDQ